MDKRARKEEKTILLQEYNKRKHIIKSKFDSLITARKKLQMWEENIYILYTYVLFI